MPIPFLLGAAAAAVGLFGVSKMVESSNNNDKAERLIENAKSIYETSQERLETQRAATNNMLEVLGATRLKVWSTDMQNFVEIFKKFNNIQWSGEVAKEKGLHNAVQSIEVMEKTSLKASEMVQAGLGSLAAGTLAGIAAYGGVGVLATASTGTAIAGLSGAAATNATLAWLGGGSLAAGGLGVAGGTAVLGGIVAAPVLAVAGIFMESRSAENLAKANATYQEALKASEKMDLMTDTLRNIYIIVDDYNDFIIELSSRFNMAYTYMNDIYQRNYELQSKKFLNRIKLALGFKFKVNYNDLEEHEKHSIHAAWLMAQIMQKLLTQNIMDKKGNVDDAAIALLESAKNSEEICE